MAWTKRQLIEAAFGELALAGYVFEIKPEEVQSALVALDTMIATWAGEGVQIGYAFGLNPDDTDPDQDSGLALVDVEAAYMNLAVKIAASKGKQLQRSTMAGARAALSGLLSRSAHANLQRQQLPANVPLGAGNKHAWRPFTPVPDTSPVQATSDTNLDFLGN